MIFKKSFFSEQDKKAIMHAIAEAEQSTSGEIRVHVEARCKHADVLDRAAEIFVRLKMHETALANGVLIYIAHEDHVFAIVGDRGINEKVSADFWESTKEVMRAHFAKGEFLEGVLFAVRETGYHLTHYFPLGVNDKNELTNEVSEG